MHMDIFPMGNFTAFIERETREGGKEIRCCLCPETVDVLVLGVFAKDSENNPYNVSNEEMQEEAKKELLSQPFFHCDKCLDKIDDAAEEQRREDAADAAAVDGADDDDSNFSEEDVDDDGFPGLDQDEYPELESWDMEIDDKDEEC
ncbi:MAG: hypothetical protein Q7T51_00885 [Candidatus Moranbacteria bacterium]|nr:hypothetical protein [Candidatus Moranbacteria bacterium]